MTEAAAAAAPPAAVVSAEDGFKLLRHMARNGELEIKKSHESTLIVLGDRWVSCDSKNHHIIHPPQIFREDHLDIVISRHRPSQSCETNSWHRVCECNTTCYLSFTQAADINSRAAPTPWTAA